MLVFCRIVTKKSGTQGFYGLHIFCDKCCQCSRAHLHFTCREQIGILSKKCVLWRLFYVMCQWTLRMSAISGDPTRMTHSCMTFLASFSTEDGRIRMRCSFSTCRFEWEEFLTQGSRRKWDTFSKVILCLFAECFSQASSRVCMNCFALW